MKRRYKRQNIAAIRIRLWNAHNMRRRRRVKDKAKYIRIQRNKRKKVKYRRERSKITYYSNHNRTLDVYKRQEWASGENYAFYDRVSHDGGIWLCVSESGSASEPAEGNSDWLQQVKGGSPPAWRAFPSWPARSSYSRVCCLITAA